MKSRELFRSNRGILGVTRFARCSLLIQVCVSRKIFGRMKILWVIAIDGLRIFEIEKFLEKYYYFGIIFNY